MEFQSKPGRLWAENEDGKLIAEITFPEERPGVANIDHTFVDGSLRGQGVAGQLVQGAADQIRGRGMKAVATCSYAVKWFDSHPDQRDLLAESESKKALGAAKRPRPALFMRENREKQGEIRSPCPAGRRTGPCRAYPRTGSG